MCGNEDAISLGRNGIPKLAYELDVMDRMMANCGLAIIYVATGQQPILDDAGNVICYNGEVYNYIKLRNEIGAPLQNEQQHRGIFAYA